MKYMPSFPRSIDSTMISTFLSCEQKFYLEYCLKLSAAGRSPDLHAGGAFATGLEVARKAFYFDGDDASLAMGRGVAAIWDYWGDYIPPKGNYKTVEAVQDAFIAYFTKWPLASDPIQPIKTADTQQPAVEFTFAIPTNVNDVDDHPILYSGRCDMVAHFGDEVVGVDEKTTKGIGPLWKYKWGLRGQFIGYTHALREGGLPAKGILVRGISLQAKQIKTIETVVSIPQHLINKWWRNLNRTLQRMVTFWAGTQAQLFYKPIDPDDITELQARLSSLHSLWRYNFGEACTAFNGCMFQDICKKSNPAKWYGNYEIRHWDPLAKDPTAKSEDTRLEPETLSLETMKKQLA